MRQSILLFLLSLILPVLHAGDQGLTLQAIPKTEAITLDGRLEEAAWKAAPIAPGGLVQWEPHRGEPAKLGVELRVLYDATHLYVGAWLPKPKSTGPVVGHLHRRDQWSASDWFEVDLDSMHDHWNACQFYVNPANVQMDVVLFGPGSDLAWDGVWDSATAVEADGWSVELRIPLSLFRIQSGNGPQTWGLNFGRQDPISREIATWAVPPRETSHIASVFGHLEGLEGLSPSQTVEWLPYLSAQRKLETTEAWDDRIWKGRGGLDARMRLGSSGELNLSLRPDFGQVEVDQAVLNLSTVETFLPEKRPFFTQGMEHFANSLGWTWFYSRRMGRGLSSPELREGERILDRPLGAEIMGAARYTGTFDGGQSLGVLAAATGSARARILDASGRERKVLVAPQATFGAFSFIQPLSSNGDRMHTLVTHMNEAGSGREAFVASTEGQVQSRDRRFTFQWELSGSRTGPKEKPVTGWHEALKATVGLGSTGLLSATAWNADKAYDVNDMGYMERADERGFDLTYQKNWDRASGPFHNRELALQVRRQADQEGRPFADLLAVRYAVQTGSQWTLRLRSRRWLPVEDDRELRTYHDARKKYLRVDGWNWHAFEFESPSSWPWSFTGSFALSRMAGGPGRESSLVQTFRPSSRWEIGLETRYLDQRGVLGYLFTQESSEAPLPGQSPGIPVVGLRRLAQFEQVLRVSHTFSTTLSLQVFLQGLAASWAYRDLRHYVDDRNLAPGLPPGAAPPQTRFSSRTLNANAVLRWAFRPGSTAYLVYTHGVSDGRALNGDGSLRPLADLAVLRRLPSDDVVQLKVSWLFR